MTFIVILYSLSTNIYAEDVEVFFYINADNDIFSFDQKGDEFVHQGDKLFRNLLILGKHLPESMIFHIYYDPSSQFQINNQYDSLYLKLTNSKIQERIKLGETNSSDFRWIDFLINKRVSTTSKKIFVFWGHGDGPREVQSFDFSHPEKSFDYLKVADVFSYKFDMIIFDACSMAYLEIVEAFASKSSYIMASQFEIPVEGIDYSHLVQLLKDQDIEGIYQGLLRDTILRQKEKFQFAPFVLLKTDKFQDFINSFIFDLKDDSTLVYQSLLKNQFSYSEDLDLRKLFRHLKIEAKKLELILYKGRGSVSLSLNYYKELIKNRERGLL